MEGRRVNHSAPKRNPLYVMFLCLVAAVFVLLLIPGNPVYMGRKSAIAFAVWMAVGIVLYMVNRTTEKVD